MKTALVTGAGGFLGRYVVEQLVARDINVRTFCRGRYVELESLGVESVRGDLRDAAAVLSACEGIDTAFHVGGVAGIWGPWRLYDEVNRQGTENLLAGCLAHHVQRMVYTSSPSVTFDGSTQEGIDESAPYATKWLAHYPRSKAAAEQAVLQANGEKGLATTALRPHLIWGPRDRHLAPRIFDRARRGMLRRVGDGTNLIDNIFVENAAAAHLAAANALRSPTAAPAGKAYFLSQSEPVNCWEWIDALLAIADLPPVERSISLRSAMRIGAGCELAWRVLRLRGEPPMTRFLAAQLGASHWFDISAARRDFNYEPKISTEEGMRRLAAAPETKAVRAAGAAR